MTTSAPSSSGRCSRGWRRCCRRPGWRPAGGAPRGGGGDVDDAQQRVGGGLDPDQPRALGHRRLDAPGRVASTAVKREAVAADHLVEEPEGAAVDVVHVHHVVAGVEQQQRVVVAASPDANARPWLPPSSDARHVSSCSRVGLLLREYSKPRCAADRRPARRWWPGGWAAPPRRWPGRAPGRRGSRGWRSRAASSVASPHARRWWATYSSRSARVITPTGVSPSMIITAASPPSSGSKASSSGASAATDAEGRVHRRRHRGVDHRRVAVDAVEQGALLDAAHHRAVAVARPRRPGSWEMP